MAHPNLLEAIVPLPGVPHPKRRSLSFRVGTTNLFRPLYKLLPPMPHSHAGELTTGSHLARVLVKRRGSHPSKARMGHPRWWGIRLKKRLGGPPAKAAPRRDGLPDNHHRVKTGEEQVPTTHRKQKKALPLRTRCIFHGSTKPTIQWQTQRD